MVRLYHETHHHLFLDNDDQNKMEDEPSLHHLQKRHKRQESRMDNRVYVNDGNIQTTPMNLLRTFIMFMKKKYDTIQVDSDSVNRMLQRSKKHIPQEVNDALDAAITMDELHIALKQGKNTKHPGCDGISHDFFQLTWETTQYDMLEIMNEMLMNEKLMDSQKHGTIICLKKIARPTQKFTGHSPS